MEHKKNDYIDLRQEILIKAALYSDILKRCLLCLNEKLAIYQYTKPDKVLNKRTDMKMPALREVFIEQLYF